MTTDHDLVERLTRHRTLGSAPRAELEWLVTQGEYRQYPANHVAVRRAEGRPPGMIILLSGHASITVDRGAGRHKAIEWYGGDVMGLLPYSRMGAPPGDSVTEEPSEALVILGKHFPEMIRQCNEVTSTLVHIMIDRARQFTSSDLNDEKMVSLGKLAAGLAHELNNPASAVTRSAKQLTERLIAADAAARRLGAARLTSEQTAALETARAICLARHSAAVHSPIQQFDRENEITDWLLEHAADDSTAEQLAETAVTVDALDNLAAVLDGETLDQALRWIATGCSVRGLGMEIEQAASRIFDLVSAVKGFTYMDQAKTPQPVDVCEGLRNTLAVLASKARSKSVGLAIESDKNIPRIDGFGGELNQVWANLIDNAIDAVATSGLIKVTATHENDTVVVRIIDDGPGIPPEIRDRVFDPFFTTKPVGAGTGLGLDIARRLVRRNGGEIDIESSPGRTAVIVTLPVTTQDSQGA